jgi:hypothetical protein
VKKKAANQVEKQDSRPVNRYRLKMRVVLVPPI